MPKKLLIIGSINMDLSLRIERFPIPCESFFGKVYNLIPGGKGAFGISRDNTTLIPTFDVQTVDSTASGDAFTVASAVKYLESDNFHESIICGCAAGALAATKEGAAPSLPTKQYINELL